MEMCWEKTQRKRGKWRDSHKGLKGKWFPLNRKVAPEHSPISCLLCLYFDKWDHITAGPKSSDLRPNPGLRNETHTVTTGFLSQPLCWYWSRLKQMFPVKLWLSPSKEHISILNLFTPHMRPGIPCNWISPNLPAPVVRSVIPKQLNMLWQTVVFSEMECGT